MTFQNQFPLENNVSQPVEDTEIENGNYFKNTGATGVVLNNYRAAKQALQEAQEAERKAKENVLNHIKERMHTGTNRFKTDFYTLKVVNQPTYSIDTTNMQHLQQCMQWVQQCCGDEVASTLLNWKPSLNKKVYDSLPVQVQQVFNQFVVMKISQTFTLEE